MKRLTAFSFGYLGWGGATKEMVAWIYYVEKKRGFRPPIFIYTGISRTARSVGFRKDDFGPRGRAFADAESEEDHSACCTRSR